MIYKIKHKLKIIKNFIIIKFNKLKIKNKKEELYSEYITEEDVYNKTINMIINNYNVDAGYAPNGKKRYWYWRDGIKVALAEDEYYDDI